MVKIKSEVNRKIARKKKREEQTKTGNFISDTQSDFVYCQNDSDKNAVEIKMDKENGDTIGGGGTNSSGKHKSGGNNSGNAQSSNIDVNDPNSLLNAASLFGKSFTFLTVFLHLQIICGKFHIKNSLLES